MAVSFFSENLRKLRKHHKITLEMLAEAIGVSKSSIADYEKARFSPPLNICRKISEYFQISIDLLEYSDIMENGENSVLKNEASVMKENAELKEYNSVLERQKNEVLLELKLQKQKVDSLQIQLKLQEQLKDSKLSEIELLRSQISLLEDKIRLQN
jgi:DNA-binding XRE family transcriptional regulator